MGQQHKPLSPLLNSADGVTSCNYRCCIRSYNNAGSSSSTCISLRKKYCGCIMSVHFNSQLLFSTLQLFQVDPILCGELFRAHSQSKYRGYPHRQTTNTPLDIGFPRNCPFCTLLFMDVNGASRNLNINNLVR